MARIYSKAGDDGTTGLFLGGRVSKADTLVDACGDLDEAVAVLGVARASSAQLDRSAPDLAAPGLAKNDRSAPDLAALLLRLQRELFVVAADLATNPAHRSRLQPEVSLVTPEMVAGLEQLIDGLVAERPLRPVFIVPGTTPTSAAIDHARTVVRRAERHVVAVQDERRTLNEVALHYLNRLSDLLFVLARHAAGEAEEPASHD